MQKRIISAIVALIITLPIIFKGGPVYNFMAYLLGLLCLKEFLDAKGNLKKIPFPIRLIAYIFMTLIVLVDVDKHDTLFILDYRIIAALFLALLLPSVLYHNTHKYDIKDAFYVLGAVLFFGLSFALIIVLRNISLKTVVFLLLLSIVTDSFAYITGYLIGKTKLLPNILPKKTWEGLIGGTVMGTFAAVIFYHTCINPEFSIYLLTLICVFLSLIAQLGDMTFSALKRQFEIKDFSNLMPGHGGILDRLDSIIFTTIAYTFFIIIL